MPGGQGFGHNTRTEGEVGRQFLRDSERTSACTTAESKNMRPRKAPAFRSSERRSSLRYGSVLAVQQQFAPYLSKGLLGPMVDAPFDLCLLSRSPRIHARSAATLGFKNMIGIAQFLRSELPLARIEQRVACTNHVVCIPEPKIILLARPLQNSSIGLVIGQAVKA